MTKLSDADKAAMIDALKQTRNLILDDVGDAGDLIELVCDAGRPVTLGGMSKELYSKLVAAYNERDTQRWLKTIC